MQTKVRPYHGYYDWQVQVLNPDTDEWEQISLHDNFWIANWKATRLSKKSLAIKKNKKEEFLDRLKGTHKDGNSGAMGAPP